MLSLMVHVVPYALVSISIPALLITVILLKSDQGYPKAVAYVTGLAAFFGLLGILSLVFVRTLPWVSQPPTLVHALLYLAIGALLLLIARNTWLKYKAISPQAAEVSTGKTSRLEEMVKRAPEKLGRRVLFGLGFVMALTSIKNVALFAAGAANIDTSGVRFLSKAIATAILVLALVWWEWLPILAYALLPRHADQLVDSGTNWIKVNQRLTVAMICVVLGVDMLAEGLRDLVHLLLG